MSSSKEKLKKALAEAKKLCLTYSVYYSSKGDPEWSIRKGWNVERKPAFRGHRDRYVHLGAKPTKAAAMKLIEDDNIKAAERFGCDMVISVVKEYKEEF